MAGLASAPPPPTEDEPGYVEARALADPTRRRVLRAMVAAGRPLHVAELADQFGLHRTAIRQHLVRLGQAGLVSESTMPPRGRGRPRLAYQPTPAAAGALEPAGRYRELASMLAEAAGAGGGPRQAGRRIGRRVGKARRGEDAITAIVEQADELGFDPVTRRRPGRRVDVVLLHCPYEDVAAQDPAVVCQLHLGLAEGIAGSIGGVEVEGMDIRDPRRAGCRLGLRRESPHPAGEAAPRADRSGR